MIQILKNSVLISNRMEKLKVSEITSAQIASLCDHTFLFPPEYFFDKEAKGQSTVYLRQKAFEGFLEDIINARYHPYSICVRPEDAKYSREFLENNAMSHIKVCSVAGFPDGNRHSTISKLSDAHIAIDEGASEIDVVTSYDLLKKGKIDGFIYDLKVVNNFVHLHNSIVKAIIETSELTPALIAAACGICDEIGVDFVKSSTGFSSYGARHQDIRIMWQYFPRGLKISGGIKPNNVMDLLEAASDKGFITVDPMKLRIGESSLLQDL